MENLGKLNIIDLKSKEKKTRNKQKAKEDLKFKG